jgi:hypothetical protein
VFLSLSLFHTMARQVIQRTNTHHSGAAASGAGGRKPNGKGGDRRRPDKPSGIKKESKVFFYTYYLVDSANEYSPSRGAVFAVVICTTPRNALCLPASKLL